EAHRVAGFVYSAMADPERGAPRSGTDKSDENIAKAIEHFEAAIDGLGAEADPNVRATLARLYLRAGANAKAIPLLSDLGAQEPSWQDGPVLLADAYAESGRNEDAIVWLERVVSTNPQLYPTLADFYERQHRWKDAAGAYAHAMELGPRPGQLRQLKTRYASALLNSGVRDDMTVARDVLKDLAAANTDDGRVL